MYNYNFINEVEYSMHFCLHLTVHYFKNKTETLIFELSGNIDALRSISVNDTRG